MTSRDSTTAALRLPTSEARRLRELAEQREVTVSMLLRQQVGRLLIDTDRVGA